MKGKLNGTTNVTGRVVEMGVVGCCCLAVKISGGLKVNRT
jgi:hypothetical protein